MAHVYKIIQTTVQKFFINSLSHFHSLLPSPHSYAAEQQQYARRSKAHEQAMKERLLEAKSAIEEEKLSKRDITCGKD